MLAANQNVEVENSDLSKSSIVYNNTHKGIATPNVTKAGG
jgi:hypothetical protein